MKISEKKINVTTEGCEAVKTVHTSTFNIYLSFMWRTITITYITIQQLNGYWMLNTLRWRCLRRHRSRLGAVGTGCMKNASIQLFKMLMVKKDSVHALHFLVYNKNIHEEMCIQST